VLFRTEALAPGSLCNFGGVAVVAGADDGRGGGIAGNGVLETSEVQVSQPQCATQADPNLIKPLGLLQRPTNLSCLANETSMSQGVTLERAFGDLSFDRPVAMVQPAGETQKFIVAEQGGRLMWVDTSGASPVMTPILDLSARVAQGFEPGLLSVAVHPGWPARREVFVTWTRQAGPSHQVVLTRFTAAATAVPTLGAETEFIWIPRDQEQHNGGDVSFMADGTLLMSVGDGNDWPATNAQNPNTLNGKFIRIDIERPDLVRGKYYSIPPDNPFASSPAPEVWALGVRNPWRFDIDPQTQQVWGADVGFLSWEEINHYQAGKNYGWPLREGKGQCLNGERTSACAPSPLYEEPVVAYSHTQGCSVTGGKVYRGAGVPALAGRYLYGDFCLGTIWGVDLEGRQSRWFLETNLLISGFGRDRAGELYVFDWGTGAIHRLVHATPHVMPARLSQTGCVDPSDATQPAAGAIAYAVNASFESGPNVSKQRYFFLPEGQTIFVANDGEWVIPPGGVVMKVFRQSGRLVETRFLLRNRDGAYNGFSYRWNAAGTDADLLTDGASVTSFGTPWAYPDRGQCLHCHTAPANATLGLDTPQLNTLGWYTQTGSWSNQLRTLSAVGIFANQLSGTPEQYPKLPSPHDTSQPLEARARAYLHTNCSGCHQPGGGGYGSADYRYTTPLAQMNVCNVSPISTSFDVVNARLLVPGDPSRSVIHARVSRNDHYRMHPYLPEPDERGRQLLAQWITSLGSCPP
jgi:glucose/arabinose dehydrogenase